MASDVTSFDTLLYIKYSYGFTSWNNKEKACKENTVNGNTAA